MDHNKTVHVKKKKGTVYVLSDTLEFFFLLIMIYDIYHLKKNDTSANSNHGTMIIYHIHNDHYCSYPDAYFLKHCIRKNTNTI